MMFGECAPRSAQIYFRRLCGVTKCFSPLRLLFGFMFVFINSMSCHLTLGILPNGASSLLIPTYKARRQVNNYKQAYNFLSLSPIHFDNVNELKTKMEWLKPKASGSKAKKGKDMDTSSANKGYYVTIASDGGRAVTDRGWQRAAFEHSR